MSALLEYRRKFIRSGAARRFWAKVDRPGPDACWEWTGTQSGNKVKYGQRLAHRVSWELANGPIPDGMWVLHRCDNGLCVNPRHLFLGTASDNNHDMMAKGRARAGRPPQKLTSEDVAAIRRIYARRDASQRTLAREYGVHQTMISKIVRGERRLVFIDEGDPVAEVGSE